MIARTIHICDFIRLLLVVIASLILVAGRPDLKTFSVISCIAFLSVIFIFSSKTLSIKQPLIPLLSLHLVLYYCFRLVDYFVMDPDMVQSFFPVMPVVDSSAGTRALAYTALATFTVYMGLWLSARWTKPYQHISSSTEPQPNVFLFVVLLCFACASAILVAIQGAEFIPQMHPLIKGFYALMNIDVWLYFALYFCFIQLSAKKRNRMLVFLLIIYTLTRALTGSRSGLVDFLMILLFTQLALSGGDIKFKLSIQAIFFVIGSIALSTILFFWVAYKRASDYGATMGSTDTTNLFEGSSVDIFWYIYNQVSYRLGSTLDATLFVFSDGFDVNYANNHVNISTAIIGSIQKLMHFTFDPTIFPASYELARLIAGDRAFFSVGDVEVSVNYLWGMFGYFYQLFGPVLSLVMLFMFAFAAGRLFIRFAGDKSRFLRISLAVAIAFSFSSTINTFGFDNLADNLGRKLVCFVFLMGLIKMLPQSRARFHTTPLGLQKMV